MNSETASTNERDTPEKTVVEGDLYYAHRDNNFITNYITGLTYLRPHAVERRTILSDKLFVSSFPVKPVEGGVCVLVGAPDSGRRTAGLKILDQMPPGAPIFELFPDWEEPDAERIPSEKNTGYLLNLTGVHETLNEEFRQQLSVYASKAQKRGTQLIIIAGEHVWPIRDSEWWQFRTDVRKHVRPNPHDIARQRIKENNESRAEWLEEGKSDFAKLLTTDSSPARAVELAEIVLAAEGPNDAEARDRFNGWKSQIEEWFVKKASGKEEVESRALQISAAFLDGSPAGTVLAAADELLKDSRLNWPELEGGALASPDDKHRCDAAKLDFSDGAVSITVSRPGIDQALIRYVWGNRPRLVPVVTTWLTTISAPEGVAANSLKRLADVLSDVAMTAGPDAIMGLAARWLKDGQKRRADLAVDVLEQLAVHPVLGAQIRRDLSGWAKGNTEVERQRAVVAVCRGRLGKEYPQIALTRLRYVLDRAKSESPRTEAITALRVLLADPGKSAVVLKTLVDWAQGNESGAFSGRAFLELLREPVPPGEGHGVAQHILTLEEESAGAIRQLFRDGWLASCEREGMRPAVAQALSNWCDAVRDEVLPAEAVGEIIPGVFPQIASATDRDFSKIFGNSDPFRAEMTEKFFEYVRDALNQGRGTAEDA
ncbi:hypothetical protein SAMN05421803_11228 [Nocardiopsis flavescens]|uniref:Uncharacterized protein n=1 Tax=Nocardiopsis flavescens TaxID=758803 RepID=A0A1M6NNN3_9ACTN|nr:hypothetical protein [Nocardiopsis flavescens]SHJ97341.1 hypothetical protein SAMN05421803_11228 [Nocardiopsis flavescens]